MAEVDVSAGLPLVTKIIRRSGPIDAHVGARVRLCRTLLGMSQDDLGRQIGVAFQQVQKYESGANRISASRLYDLARVLAVPVSFFFDDLPSPSAGSRVPASADDAISMMRRETMELVRAYYAIPAAPLRDALYRLIKALASLGAA